MKCKGFTLVEMVMTIVILGITFVGVGGIIELGSKGYSDSVDRQRLQNQARFVIEKISREARHAVPNSFSAFSDASSDKCLSFYPIEIAGYYHRDEANRTLRFVVDNQGSRLSGADSHRLVINPSQPDDLQSNSNSVSLSSCRNDSNSTCSETELSTGVYGYDVSDDFSSHSVANRYYTYSGTVTYCISSAGFMSRSEGSGSKVTVADSVNFAQSQFKYKEATLQRGGLIHMDLLFSDGGEESFYKHDVQVLNVP